MILFSKRNIIFFRDGEMQAMDHRKRCKVGSTCMHFQVVGCVIESNPTIGEGVLVSHHLFQSKNYRINYARNFNFHNQKDGDQNA